MAEELLELGVECEKIIFSRIFKSDENVQSMRNTLKMELNNPSVFENEYYVFYTLILNYPKLIFDKVFLKVFLTTQRNTFVKSKNIDLSSYKFGEVDEYVQFTESTIDLFDECCRTEVDDAAFYRNLAQYKIIYTNKASMNVLNNSLVILSEGLKVNRRELKGYEDMRGYTVEELNKIDKIVTKSKRMGAITYGVTPEEEESETSLKKLGDYGIEGLDIPILEGEMHSILAPSKGGKSRFCTYVIARLLCDFGQNCLVWSVENGVKGWEYLLRARLFNREYNTGVTDVTKKAILDDSMLRGATPMSDEIRQMELASWTKFKHNEAYGRLTSMDEDLNIDTFLELLDEQVKRHDIKVVCIDYLQLIGRGSSNITKTNELVAEAYKKTLQYLKHNKIAGIFPGQLKQEVVTNFSRMKEAELGEAELRNAAGESYEVIKTPDVNLVLYASLSDLRNGDMKILSAPCRNNAIFDPIQLCVDLGSCGFTAVNNKDIIQLTDLQ